VNATAWSRGLEVAGGGTGVVSHAGPVLLRQLTDRTGLTAALSAALPSPDGGLDRGRVFADLACAIADGARVISDFRVMGDQDEVFGQVASVPTAWRTLKEAAAGGDRTRRKITAAISKARRYAWSQVIARHGQLPAVQVADRQLEGITCIRLDATVVPAHSDKEQAEPNFKGSGHHPVLAECDNVREPLAWMMRPGSAGSNTAADHLALLDEAIAALPPQFRRKLMVTCDGAGASHDLVKRLDELAGRRGCELVYSVGWALAGREKTALRLVPETAWEAAIDAKGEVRERRSDEACGNGRCGHRACWIEEAHVTELTGLLRKGPDGDRLQAWPKSMRVFARRERPHPGAQLTLLEAADGWRYTLWATNLPEDTRGWRGQCAYIDAGHRVHARVEDHPHREGHRARPFPVPRLRAEQGLAGRVDDRLHPAVLAPAPRPRRQARESRAQDPALPPLPRSRPARARRAPQDPQDSRRLALGHRDHHRLESYPGPPAPNLTSENRPCNQGKENRGCGTSGYPARQPGRQRAPTPKNRSRRRSSRRSDRHLSSVKDRG